MTHAEPKDFSTLAHIEDIARIALCNVPDDDWTGLEIAWASP